MAASWFFSARSSKAMWKVTATGAMGLPASSVSAPCAAVTSCSVMARSTTSSPVAGSAARQPKTTPVTPRLRAMATSSSIICSSAGA